MSRREGNNFDSKIYIYWQTHIASPNEVHTHSYVNALFQVFFSEIFVTCAAWAFVLIKSIFSLGAVNIRSFDFELFTLQIIPKYWMIQNIYMHNDIFLLFSYSIPFHLHFDSFYSFIFCFETPNLTNSKAPKNDFVINWFPLIFLYEFVPFNCQRSITSLNDAHTHTHT